MGGKKQPEKPEGDLKGSNGTFYMIHYPYLAFIRLDMELIKVGGTMPGSEVCAVVGGRAGQL